MSICRHPAADAPVRNLIKLQLRSCQIGSSDFPKFRSATVKLVKFHIELSTVQFHNHSFKQQPRKREGMGRLCPGNQWASMKNQLSSAAFDFFGRRPVSFASSLFLARDLSKPGRRILYDLWYLMILYAGRIEQDWNVNKMDQNGSKWTTQKFWRVTLSGF